MRPFLSRLALLALLVPSPVLAAPQAEAPPKDLAEDPKTSEARALYTEGLALSKKMQWNEALVAFEKSRALRPHAATTFNIGYCQRALGRYVDARVSFARALAENAQSGMSHLPASTVQEIEQYLLEISTLMVKLKLRVKPTDSKVLLDGRPLTASSDAKEGEAKLLADGSIAVDVNPGVHVIHISAKGFADVVLNKSWSPGTSAELPVDLAQLPAKIHVESDVPNAFVKIDGKDVGVTPVDTERPAGEHKIEVEKDGYVTYSSTVRVDPGGRADLRARLVQESVPITKKWWFWTGASAVVLSGITATYFLTRRDPEPPPYDGGRMGWVVPAFGP